MPLHVVNVTATADAHRLSASRLPTTLIYPFPEKSFGYDGSTLSCHAVAAEVSLVGFAIWNQYGAVYDGKVASCRAPAEARRAVSAPKRSSTQRSQDLSSVGWARAGVSPAC